MRKDGAFGFFGYIEYAEKPLNGSTWLTSYIARSLVDISDIVNIPHKIVENAVDYLIKQQAENGSFIEQGAGLFGRDNHFSLTLQVLEALEANKVCMIDKIYKLIHRINK